MALMAHLIRRKIEIQTARRADQISSKKKSIKYGFCVCPQIQYCSPDVWQNSRSNSDCFPCFFPYFANSIDLL